MSPASTTADTTPQAAARHVDALPALDATTLCQAFQLTAARFADHVALRTLGGEVELTWREYAARVEEVAAGLAGIGIARGATVAMMLSNRPEAFVVDTAAMHLGAVPFSIYNTSSPEQVEYLLGHAEATVVVTERQFVDRVLAAREHLPALEHVVLVDDAPAGTMSLADLARAGDERFDFERTWRLVTPDDLATLIYTSGTTGPPKGVELTHANVMWEWKLLHRVHPLSPAGRLISYLPMAHLADRCAAHYAAIVSGAGVTCVQDPRSIVQALPEVRPTMWLAVPRIWEKLRAALTPMVAAAENHEHLGAQVRANLGLDDAELLISGAAPIAPEVLRFFADLGIVIYEAWGMTETGAGVTISPPGAHRVGTVGRPVPGVEVVLADDGELLVRGPIVMRGYRNDPERTAEAIDPDGWMHTGDVGQIDADGYVTITDRKKELIINAAGKNMSPANIENALKAACPLIGSAVTIGDRRPYNTALIVLDPDAARYYAQTHGIDAATAGDLTTSGEIQAAIADGIQRANQRLSRVEQIRKHILLAETWDPGGDELTPTMKLRRTPIAEKYAAQIEAMYAP